MAVSISGNLSRYSSLLGGLLSVLTNLQFGFVARPADNEKPIELLFSECGDRHTQLPADVINRVGMSDHEDGLAEMVSKNNFNCVSAWNIDPSGGVIGVQF